MVKVPAESAALLDLPCDWKRNEIKLISEIKPDTCVLQGQNEHLVVPFVTSQIADGRNCRFEEETWREQKT